jgi:hypothetical protein
MAKKNGSMQSEDMSPQEMLEMVLEQLETLNNEFSEFKQLVVERLNNLGPEAWEGPTDES